MFVERGTEFLTVLERGRLSTLGLSAAAAAPAERQVNYGRVIGLERREMEKRGSLGEERREGKLLWSR